MQINRYPDEMRSTVQEVKVLLRWFPIILVLCSIVFVLSIGGTIYRYLTVEDVSVANGGSRTPPRPGGTPPPHPNMPTWYEGVVKIRAGSGTGSGFFIKPNYIVSNAHVVQAAVNGEVVIQFSKDDKRDPLRGKVVWKGDPNGKKEDIAVIQVPPQDASLVCQLGKSSQVRKTGKVRVLGYPLNADDLTITEGTISGILRTSKIFQTDAVSNMGNSGGPLVSLDQGNKVIGIIVSESDGVKGKRIIEGTNYAIAIDYAWIEIEKHIR